MTVYEVNNTAYFLNYTVAKIPEQLLVTTHLLCHKRTATQTTRQNYSQPAVSQPSRRTTVLYKRLVALVSGSACAVSTTAVTGNSDNCTPGNVINGICAALPPRPHTRLLDSAMLPLRLESATNGQEAHAGMQFAKNASASYVKI